MVKSNINVKRILKINAQMLQSIVPDLEANKKKHRHTGSNAFSAELKELENNAWIPNS